MFPAQRHVGWEIITLRSDPSGVPSEINERIIADHGFLSELGVTIESEEEGTVTVSLPYDEFYANPGGALQGGVVATLLDHAAGAALRTTFDTSDGTVPGHASTDLNVSYLKPAADDLTAVATVLRAGGSTAVVRVEVTDSEGDVVAAGRVTLHIDRENTFGV